MSTESIDRIYSCYVTEKLIQGISFRVRFFMVSGDSWDLMGYYSWGFSGTDPWDLRGDYYLWGFSGADPWDIRE